MALEPTHFLACEYVPEADDRRPREAATRRPSGEKASAAREDEAAPHRHAAQVHRDRALAPVPADSPSRWRGWPVATS